MAVYAALRHLPEGSDWMTPEVREDHRAFGAAASEVIWGAAALCPVGSAATITVAGGPGGDVPGTDGPYARAAEILIGLYVLEAADLDSAARTAMVTWASPGLLPALVPTSSTPALTALAGLEEKIKDHFCRTAGSGCFGLGVLFHVADQVGELRP